MGCLELLIFFTKLFADNLFSSWAHLGLSEPLRERLGTIPILAESLCATVASLKVSWPFFGSYASGKEKHDGGTAALLRA